MTQNTGLRSQSVHLCSLGALFLLEHARSSLISSACIFDIYISPPSCMGPLRKYSTGLKPKLYLLQRCTEWVTDRFVHGIWQIESTQSGLYPQTSSQLIGIFPFWKVLLFSFKWILHYSWKYSMILIHVQFIFLFCFFPAVTIFSAF